ncbi:uncharacterized protein TNCV_4097041 [Trichonephila clavipes]|nr:uncharacterized protein TNCV_4097041 [Trichonephila clavipes]
MPPILRSQNEAHEIHRGKGLEVRLSLALNTIQVTGEISSSLTLFSFFVLAVYIVFPLPTTECLFPRAMITNFFIPELNNHDVQELWFQQDGATCHTAHATIDLLKDTFGDRLISRFGPVNWPPRSCD